MAGGADTGFAVAGVLGWTRREDTAMPTARLPRDIELRDRLQQERRSHV